MYKDIGGYDMKYDGIKEMCRETWSEKLNYVCIDMTKSKKEVKIVFSMRTKTHILQTFPKTKPFSFLNIMYYVQLKTEKI